VLAPNAARRPMVRGEIPRRCFHFAHETGRRAAPFSQVDRGTPEDTFSLGQPGSTPGPAAIRLASSARANAHAWVRSSRGGRSLTHPAARNVGGTGSCYLTPEGATTDLDRPSQSRPIGRRAAFFLFCEVI
jgi:hypothetical protein